MCCSIKALALVPLNTVSAINSFSKLLIITRETQTVILTAVKSIFNGNYYIEKELNAIMNVIIKNDYKEVSELAANYMLNTIKAKNDAVLGLPTGSTPLEMYKILVKEYMYNNISFKYVKTFNLDEYRGIEKTNTNSYYYFMNQNLFSHIDIEKENINIPNGMAIDAQQECISYEHKIKEAGPMDILFLGIGENGHIGFNEPAGYFEPYTHEVQLQKNTIEVNSRFFNNIDEVPKTAITMGIKTILSAKKIVLLAAGLSKADAIAQTVNGKITPQLPASILKLHNDITIIIDKDAARNI